MLDGLLLLAVVLALFAVIDVPLQRRNLANRLKMSHQEAKQEHKETEGNVEVKGRIKARMREMAKKRMLAAVPKADLVVMNPTHYAVALKYDEGRMAAPRVVAKGADLMALKIRDLAREHKVPVLQAAPLARALYTHGEVDHEIPARLFSAVAQVLAYVYQLRAALAGHAAMPSDLPPITVPPDLDPHTAEARRARSCLSHESPARTAEGPARRPGRIAGRPPAAGQRLGLDLPLLRSLGAPLFIVMVLAMMVLPLPPWMLDLLFTFNIAMALIVVMVASQHGAAAGLCRLPGGAAGHHAAAPVAERGLHPGGAAGRPHRRGRGRQGDRELRPLSGGRQLRRRPDRVRGAGGDQLHRGHQGCRAHRRGRRALHPGRHARQADGDRRRPERRPDRREGSQAPPHRGGRRGRLLRLHGRCQQVRARRRHRRHADPGDQHRRRLPDRRDQPWPERRRIGRPLCAAGRGRRPGGADPRPADLGGCGHGGLARGQGAEHRQPDRQPGVRQQQGTGHHRRHHRHAGADPRHAQSGVPADRRGAGWPGLVPAPPRQAGRRRRHRRRRPMPSPPTPRPAGTTCCRWTRWAWRWATA